MAGICSMPENVLELLGKRLGMTAEEMRILKSGVREFGPEPLDTD